MDRKILDDVHAFWFGTLAAFDSFPADRFGLWFSANAAADAEIAQRFGGALEEAAAAEIDLASLTADQQVALIVLLDQFPRNIHRGTARAYSYDDRARDLAGRIAEHGLQGFKLVERVFVILPFGHSESLADQDRALALFVHHVDPIAPNGHPFYDACRVQSQKYRDIVARFGRFPHRNSVVARTTTPEEAHFLSEVRMSPS